MKNDPHNLLYKYKTEGTSPNDFRNYQNPVEVFKYLRDGNRNPKEILKEQIHFKSGLGEIKKGSKISKSEDQISVIQNVQFSFISDKELLIFRDYSLLLFEAKCKAKYGRGLKILTPE